MSSSVLDHRSWARACHGVEAISLGEIRIREMRAAARGKGVDGNEGEHDGEPDEEHVDKDAAIFRARSRCGGRGRDCCGSADEPVPRVW